MSIEMKSFPICFTCKYWKINFPDNAERPIPMKAYINHSFEKLGEQIAQYVPDRLGVCDQDKGADRVTHASFPCQILIEDDTETIIGSACEPVDED